jgi:hypothetical protein
MSYIGNEPTSVAFLTDTFSGNGSTTAFTMSAAPATTTSILVAVTGVLQDPSTYSVVGTTLTFSAAPPSGTGNISVRYLGIPASGVTTTAYRTITEFTATAGQTTFTPPSYTPGFINVYRNGALLSTTDYTATNGTTVVLGSAASASDLVTIESFYVSSVLNAIPATAGSVGTTYLAGSSVTQAKIASGVAGTGPAFSAYTTGSTSVPNTTFTKVAYGTEEFDTNSNYDTSLSRFTPTVAGYYQISASYNFSSASPGGTNSLIALYKNGSWFKSGSGGNVPYYNIAALVYMNGSTDYLEIYAYQSSGAPLTIQNSTVYQFSGVLVRGA